MMSLFIALPRFWVSEPLTCYASTYFYQLRQIFQPMHPINQQFHATIYMSKKILFPFFGLVVFLLAPLHGQRGQDQLMFAKDCPYGFTKYTELLPQSEHSRKNFLPSFRIRSLWPIVPHAIFIGVLPSHSPHLK